MNIAITAFPFGACLAIFCWYLWKGLRSGELLVGEDGPQTLIKRAESPRRYWAIIAFWGVLTAIAAVEFTLVIFENSK